MKMKQERRPKKTAKGSSISDESFNYYKRVNENLKDLAETDQDIFFTNVFRQLQSEALLICQHKILSFNIEQLLKFAQPKHLCLLWNAFKSDWTTTCKDAYASHVFHSLILRFPVTFDADANTLSINKDDNDNNSDTEESGEAEPVTSTREMFLEFCSFIKENLAELITDVYATHIVRATFQVLSNTPVANDITVVHQNKKSSSYKEKLHVSKPDETFHKQFFKMSKIIVNSPDFTDYTSDKSANPVIQLLVHLTCQLKSEKGEKLCKKLIDLCGFFDVPAVDPDTHLTDHSRLPLLMTDVYATYLVQLLLKNCSEELFLTWYESCFKDRLIAYAVHEQSNFVLQQVISRCSSKEMFTSIFDEITPYLEDMLSMKHMGVVKMLVQKCQSLGTKQKKIVKKLLDAFHCTEEDTKIMIVPLLLAMKTYEVYMKNIVIPDEVENPENPEKFAKIEITNHGSMIIQTLFNFGNPKLFVDSILHLTPKQMVSMMCDYFGSFAIRDYFKSSAIGEKSKDAILKKISGSYSDIACDRVGSHSLQNIWPFLSINQKTTVVEELGQHKEKVKKNKYGYYVSAALALNTFYYNPQEWQVAQTALTKKRKMFDDIIDPNCSGKKSKKSSESEDNHLNSLNGDDEPKDAIDFDCFTQKTVNEDQNSS